MSLCVLIIHTRDAIIDTSKGNVIVFKASSQAPENFKINADLDH